MLPLIPTLALSFLSFIASAFVILRIIIPILPPHPLSRRVAPSEFGLPNFKTLSPADKSHIWLASCDILALAIFLWQAITEYLGGPTLYDVSSNPFSAVRLWFALTLRQSCLLVVASLTLLHVRLGRPVTFGGKHWMLWAPTLLLVVTSTAVAGVLASTGLSSLFVGLVAYSATMAVVSSVAFGCLIGTLVIIKRNIAAFNDIRDPWPPVQEVSEKPRPSFVTEDVDALKDGSSWITSRASSRQESISAFSFSTHHSRMPSNASSRVIHPAVASHPSIAAKSSFWFSSSTPFNGRESPIPPVPPLPAPYRPTSPLLQGDPDPFRRDGPRDRMGSQSSWLTEPTSEQTSLSAWSFPTSRPASPMTSPAYPSTPDLQTTLLPSSAVTRPFTPAMTSADVLGGYGYAPEMAKAEKGVGALAVVPVGDLDVSVYRAIGWLVTIWVPFGLSLPYYLMVHPHATFSAPVIPILLVLSVTLSSPLLATNILLRSPLPIPSGLFDTYPEASSAVMRASSPASTLPSPSHEYKRSASVTVVEERRSGDVWVSNGDAVGGKSKFGRAIGLLYPNPKLAVLPSIGDLSKDEPLTPPLPIQFDDSMRSAPHTPQSEISAEMGVRRNHSQASSYISTVDESAAFATQIMIAQRHYSAVATTMVFPPSPEHKDFMEIAATGVEPGPAESKRRSGHLRVRSVSSMTGSRSPISPPPSAPLPPTPPSIKNLKGGHRLTHRKSASSSVYSFGAIDTTAEIDALSAGLLPLLVPGIKVGKDVKIRTSWRSSTQSSVARSSTVGGKPTPKGQIPSEMGGLCLAFSSPEMHSTPLGRVARPRKTSGHNRQHLSLPSLSLGKDGTRAVSDWREDVDSALGSKADQYSDDGDASRRNSLQWEGDLPTIQLNVVDEEDEPLRPPSPANHNRASLGRSSSTRNPDALPADIPEGISMTARNSLVTLINALDQDLAADQDRDLKIPPPSAASTVTLFEFDPIDRPLAESTPHESNKTHSRYSGSHQAPPPVPPLPQNLSRRPSIVYIKSDENATPTTTTATTTTTTTTSTTTTTRPTTPSPKRLAEWSSRVRPLVPKPKTSKLQLKAKPSVSENAGVSSSPSRGLRALSLLKDRDVNRDVTGQSTRPLVVGKKQKKVVDENSGEERSPARKGLRPLKLVRSETTKQRAALRESEILPEVVVRPPSESQHVGFGFTF